MVIIHTNNIPPKRQRILLRLISARAKSKPVRLHELQKIASKPYVYEVLRDFIDLGLVIRIGRRGQYKYVASDLAVRLSNLGTLPRWTQKRKKSYEEEQRTVKVCLEGPKKVLDIQNVWMEGSPIRIRLDSYSRDVLRAHCGPSRRSDRARQRSHSCSDFSITISKYGACRIVAKTERWMKSLAKWMLYCGLGEIAVSHILHQVESQLPFAQKRVEMLCLDPKAKSRQLYCNVRTRLGDQVIETNINYSTSVDYEIFGTWEFVDNWLSALGAAQHNQVVALAALREQIGELARRMAELEKEQKKKNKEDEAREPYYYF